MAMIAAIPRKRKFTNPADLIMQKWTEAKEMKLLDEIESYGAKEIIERLRDHDSDTLILYQKVALRLIIKPKLTRKQAKFLLTLQSKTKRRNSQLEDEFMLVLINAFSERGQQNVYLTQTIKVLQEQTDFIRQSELVEKLRKELSEDKESINRQLSNIRQKFITFMPISSTSPGLIIRKSGAQISWKYNMLITASTSSMPELVHGRASIGNRQSIYALENAPIRAYSRYGSS